MYFMPRLLGVTLFLIFSLWRAHTVHAQEIDNESAQTQDLRSLPFDNPQMREYFAMAFQQSVDSPVMDRILTALKSGENPPPNRQATLASERHTVVRHIRAKEGIPLPSSSDIEKIEAERSEADKKFAESFLEEEHVKKAFDASLENLALEAQKKVTPPLLPSCPSDITKLISLENGGEVKAVKNETVLGDILFIKGEKPMDTDLAFGVGTTVIQYSSEEDDYVSYVAAMQGIECLPYRIRFTEGHIVHDLGLNALKNYDFNPKGELYEGIKQRLSEYR